MAFTTVATIAAVVIATITIATKQTLGLFLLDGVLRLISCSSFHIRHCTVIIGMVPCIHLVCNVESGDEAWLTALMMVELVIARMRC